MGEEKPANGHFTALHTHPQTPGPSDVSAGCSGLTGVQPAQLAEAGQPEFEKRLLLRAQCVRQRA